jgi:hypothetical protein
MFFSFVFRSLKFAECLSNEGRFSHSVHSLKQIAARNRTLVVRVCEIIGRLKDVPVDACWSVIVYNKHGSESSHEFITVGEE